MRAHTKSKQANILSPPVIGLKRMWKMYGQEIDNDTLADLEFPVGRACTRGGACTSDTGTFQ